MWINTEIVGGLIIALIGLVVVLLREVSTSHSTNVATNETIATQANTIASQAKTLIQYNNELQDFLTERAVWFEQRDQMKREIADLRKQLQAIQQKYADDVSALEQKLANALAEAKVEVKTMAEKIDGMTALLELAQKRVRELEHKEKVLTDEINEAKKRINALELAGRAKDAEIVQLQKRVSELETALEKSQAERVALEQEKARLQYQIDLLKNEPGAESAIEQEQDNGTLE